MRFLIVDDSPADRELAIRKLRQAFPDSEFVEAGQQTEFEATLAQSFDVAITGYALEWSNGFQILERIATQWPGVPVIMLTDSGSEEIAVEGTKRGLADYVVKRNLDRLPLAVRDSLVNARLQQRMREMARRRRRSEARYRAISELTSDYAFAYKVHADGTTELEWVTDAFYRITGFTRSEMAAAGGWRALLHPDDVDIVETHRALVNSGKHDVAEYRICTRDQGVRWLRVTSRPVWSATKQRVVRTYSAAQDITDRKLAEEALRQSEARFRAIFDNAAIGVAIAGPDGRIVAANPALARMLGYEQAELAGMAIPDITHPEDMAVESRLYIELVAGQRSEYQLEKRFVRKDDTHLWTRLAVSHALDASGNIELVIGVVEDITEQRAAQQALIQAEKLSLSSTLVANLAHHINNPIQAILGCLGLAEESLLREEQPGGDALIYLNAAINETRRAAGIVADLRDLDRHALPEERELTNICDLLERALALSHDLVSEAGITVHWERPARPMPLLRLVADRVFQVLLHLILNARDAMPRGGELRVTASRTLEPAGVAITIADTGEGIPQEIIPNLFEPFHTTKEGSIGLGLFITRYIIEDHGGTVDVTSPPGQGTTVRVWLPEIPT